MKTKKTSIPLFCILLILVISPLSPVRGEPAMQNYLEIPTVFQLLEKQTELDGEKITYQGEVIGQAIFEKKGVFVNVMDREFNALGIYLDKPDLSKITNFGRYGRKGDYIVVSGTFHKVCAQHGGDTDLHGDTITVIKKGYKLQEERLPISKIIICMLLIISTLLVYFFPPKTKKRF